MIFGQGTHQYTVQENWWTLPDGWEFGWIPAVAVDSQDRVYVYSRSEHPMVVFDRDGNFLTSWGDDILKDAHGIFIDADDNIYCVERETHVMRKFTTEGELLMTLGTPDEAGAEGEPFNLPTDFALGPDGEMYISDGYGNARVHKYSPDGELIKSWGKPGTGPGEFDLPHCVRVDPRNRLMVADRENNRIQFFTLDGEYIEEWGDLLQPDTIFIDEDELVYIAELDQRISIMTLDGEVVSQWGSERGSTVPGEFLACPHGIWVDSHGDIYVGEVQADARLQKYIRQR
ncbi:MAG: peptidyl-alpha-hydroxyglycine alpha-amidating lyase family protein [Candidatus Poribacteria bacterium]|nr:peptidyl-alpha-hydroxyglycine alpha-amidating lyase family protein [Candidatus Poribacteria bacterium]